jgi:hypothetical protein
MILQTLSLEYFELEVFEGLSDSGSDVPLDLVIIKQADFILYLNIHQLYYNKSMNRSEISNDFNF